MSKRKVRNFTAVFFVGLFALTWEPIFIWFLVGSLVLLQSESESETTGEVKGRKNVTRMIREDARRFQVKLPSRPSRRSLLIQIYLRYNESKKRYPHLKSEYREVINEMWGSLATDDSSEHWNQVLTSVLGDWPVQTTAVSSLAVKDKLQKVKELSRQWDEAKREALGGVNV